MSRSRHLVDPELLALLDLLPTRTLDASMLPELRDPNRLPLGPIANSERVNKCLLTATGPDGAPDVPLVLYRPPASAGQVLPCIYHIHGGGYVGGSAHMLEPIHRAMAAALNCVIVSVEYRLAPETVFPGPLDDCHAGLAWLFAHTEELAIGPIGVRGESAGGGLAAALALLVRDRGELTLAFQQLLYPMLDDRSCTADPHPFAGEFVWNRESNAFAWRAYLGTEPGSPGISPYAAPARAKDSTGLPPAYIATGSLDLFVDENIAYATHLTRAGVPTELHLYPGGVHAFDIHPTADIANRARRDALDWLRRHMTRDSE